jgi:tRNA threonylcarbamoyladenosine biosynthesis protein TsaE
MEILFESESALMDYARQLAAQAQPGHVIALCGNLGAGKTHFTKGYVHGLGYTDTVSSPTFSLVQEYHGGRLSAYHFDFYRMDHPQEVLNLGWDDYLDQPGVCIIEWADRFPSLFPEHTQWYHLTVVSPVSRSLIAGNGPSVP